MAFVPPAPSLAPPAASLKLGRPSAVRQVARADLPLPPVVQEILARENVCSASQLQQPGNRAEVAFLGSRANMEGPEGLRDFPGGSPAGVWTYGQAMVASLEHGQLTGDFGHFDAMVDGLEKYREDRGGYGPHSDGQHGRGHRFYDDNAWIGLAFMQAYEAVPDPLRKAIYLRRAREIFRFLETGLQPDGAMIWTEKARNPTLNACTEGPASELALRLYIATDKAGYLLKGRRLYHHLRDNLLIRSGTRAGLYADRIDLLSRRRFDDIYSYNQGTPVGAAVLLSQITGRSSYRDEAHQCARASLLYFGQADRLWKQPPVFNAIYLRNLLPTEPGSLELLRGYGERLWNDALDASSGLFDRAAPVPLGNYGSKKGIISTIDQAGIVQIFHLAAFPSTVYSVVTQAKGLEGDWGLRALGRFHKQGQV